MSTAPATTSRSEEILSTAARLIDTQGYDAMGMRSLADAVGIQPASLYNHFGSKEEILYGVALRGSRDFIEELNPILASDEARVERLRQMVRTYVSIHWERRIYIRASSRELRGLSREHRSEIVAMRHDFQERFQQFVAGGVSEGAFSCPHPEIAAIAVLVILNGVSEWFNPDGDVGIEGMTQYHEDLVLKLLLP